MKNTVSASAAHVAFFVVLGLGVAFIGFWDAKSSQQTEFAELSHLQSEAAQ
ncbi:hypothetical protein [Phaeobacter sp. 11ANDIMAR09]|uniref:hypothetical protein n=1 Tax=Phaeobacter sp. 11ANDIMAR09 TaxID=1225647 RepID=UPI000ACBF157|nr:hypothetical protein [Phaeobacter sp. 11ANDIMAR09]